MLLVHNNLLLYDILLPPAMARCDRRMCDTIYRIQYARHLFISACSSFALLYVCGQSVVGLQAYRGAASVASSAEPYLPFLPPSPLLP